MFDKPTPLTAEERRSILTGAERVQQRCHHTSHAGYLAGLAHHNLARYEATVDRLISFANDMAEHDCEYGDGCPVFGRGNHGRCQGCLAREALEGLQ